MSIKTLPIALMLMFVVIVPCLDARSAGITAAQWKDLNARVHALETAIEVDAEKNTDENDAGQRLVVEKIEQFISELTSLRKEVFGRIKQVRKDIKAHAGDIVVLKHSYKALEQLLGNPVIMQTVAHDAKTVFEVIAMIDRELMLVKQMFGASAHPSSASSDSASGAAPASSAEVPTSSDASAPASTDAADSSSSAVTSSTSVASA